MNPAVTPHWDGRGMGTLLGAQDEDKQMSVLRFFTFARHFCAVSQPELSAR